jgi:hypothetical protein
MSHPRLDVARADLAAARERGDAIVVRLSRLGLQTPVARRHPRQQRRGGSTYGRAVVTTPAARSASSEPIRDPRTVTRDFGRVLGVR